MPIEQTVTLVATVVSTVDLGVAAEEIQVLNDTGSAEVWFTVDGTTPTVGGANEYYLPAAIGNLGVSVPKQFQSEGPVQTTKVKLISPGTPKVTMIVG